MGTYEIGYSQEPSSLSQARFGALLTNTVAISQLLSSTGCTLTPTSSRPMSKIATNSPSSFPNAEVAPLLQKRDSVVVSAPAETGAPLGETGWLADLSDTREEADPLAFWQGFGIAAFFGPLALAVMFWLKSVECSPARDRKAFVKGALPGLLFWTVAVVAFMIYVMKKDPRD